MNKVVLWSGGYDSTLILNDLLKEDDNVKALTITHPQLPSIEQEKIAREKLKKKMKPFNHREGLARSDKEWCLETWLESMVPLIEKESTVYMGVHMGGMFNKESDYKYLLDTFGTYSKKKDLNIALPLMTLTKPQIIERIMKTDLFEDCWTCTKPQGVFQCGECVECKNLYKAQEILAK